MNKDFEISIAQNLFFELTGVQEVYRSYLVSLPAQVQSLGKKMAGLEVSLSPGRLSVLALPFWLGRYFGLALEVQRQLALANLFGLQHFSAQDNLIDEKLDDEDRLSLTILGTLCLQQMFQIYSRYFPSDSSFWTYLDKYWREWADSLIWERRSELPSSFSEDDLLKAARKAAPLKICSSGMALLGEQPQLISDLETAVDKMHMVMQMADDLADLEDDLAQNRYNAFISLMEVKGSIDHDTLKDITQVGRILFTTSDEQSFFKHMQQIADETRILLGGLGLIEWADLVAITVQKTRLLVRGHMEDIVPDDLGSIFVPTGVGEA